MPKMKYKAPKKLKDSDKDSPVSLNEENSYPSTYLRVNDAILDSVDVDDVVEVKLKVRISGKESRKNSWGESQEVQLEVHEAEFVVDGYEGLDGTDE